MNKTIVPNRYSALFGSIAALFAGLAYFTSTNSVRFTFGFLSGLSLALLIACGLKSINGGMG